MNEVEWIISPGLVEYPDALKVMDERVDLIQKGNAKELVWLLEHPPLYSAGTSAKPQDLLTPNRFPVFKTGRGGQYTYHGPGQRVAYVMLDLNRRRRDIRAYVSSLETWIINTLAKFNIRGERRSDRIGIWVRRTDLNNPEREDKIGAIGIRIKRWVTLHGISINVSSDLEHFGGIIPCGIGGYGVTSFEDIGQPLEFYDLDVELRTEFDRLFGEYGEMALK
ncbi:MAG: lipoyl(octanoyl) transferase LipB [Thalassobaculaceae bacterium]|nr:MAG: lipoate-protein ligase B [Candidatus Endolissoclinum sp. TMED55]